MANATGATEFVDNTTADAFIDEVWSRQVIISREAELVFAKLVDRRFEKDAAHGDTIHVGNVVDLNVRTKVANTAIDYETQTESNTNITIGTWEYAAFALETRTKKQSMQDLVKLYSPKMGYAMALAVDDALAGLVDNLSQRVGTLTQGLEYADYLRALQYLNDANVPRKDRAFIISPAEETNAMQLPHFINNDFSKLHGSVSNAADRAYIGSFLGVPVYVSTNVEGSNAAGHDNVLLHKEAFALVMQIDTPSYHFFDIDFFAYKHAVENLYGIAEMRDDHAVWLESA